MLSSISAELQGQHESWRSIPALFQGLAQTLSCRSPTHWLMFWLSHCIHLSPVEMDLCQPISSKQAWAFTLNHQQRKLHSLFLITHFYRNAVAEVRGARCTKNDVRSLFPVGARSDKMAVRKTSIFGKVYVFSDTVVCAFSEAAFGEILASIRCPKTSPIRNIFSYR